MPSDIAVVVPVYCRPGQVLQALDSVADQSLQPSLLVVVDDGSPDGTSEAVRNWLAAAPQGFVGCLVVQEHQGAAAARNRGLAECSSHTYVAFLDSDDQWPPDFLERALSRLAEHPSAVAVTTDQRLYTPQSPDAGPTPAQLRSLAPLAADPTAWLMQNDGGVLSASVFRSEAVKRAAGFDPAVATGQDWKMALELSLLGPWLHAPGAPVEMGAAQPRHAGEAGHLSLRFPDRHRRWATILESFVETHLGAAPVRRQRYAPALAMRWSRAARELSRTGRRAEAGPCARRAALWWWRDRSPLRAGVSVLAAVALGLWARLRGSTAAGPRGRELV